MPHANKNDELFEWLIGYIDKEEKKERERINYIRNKGGFRAMMKALPEMPPVDSLSYKLIGKKLPFKK